VSQLAPDISGREAGRDETMENTGAPPTAAGKPGIGDAFRFDINALRALSVVAVVGFHC
jgi:hypothetical protein